MELLYQSETRIVVLNSGATAAGVVLRQAARFGITAAGYAWVVTDGVTGNFVNIKGTFHANLHFKKKSE